MKLSPLFTSPFPKVETKKEYLKRGFALFTVTTFALFVEFMIYLLSSTYMQEITLGSMVYYLMAAFSHAAMFTVILYVVSYLPFSLFKKGYRIGTILSFILSFLLVLLGYVNGEVFKIYKFHINGFVLDLLFGKGAGDIFVINNALIIRCVGIILLFLVLFAVLISISTHFYLKIYKKIKLILFTLLVSLICSHLSHAYAAAANVGSIQDVSACLPQYYPLTANSLMMDLGLVNKNDLYVDKKGGGNLNYPLNPIQITKEHHSKKNIIFLYIDSWNHSTFNKEVTPNMAKWAQGASTFTNHLSSSNGTRGSIFGSFFSLSSTYWRNFEISGLQPVFVNTLIKEGYQIQAYPSANLVNPPFYRLIFGNVKDLHTETEGKSCFDRDNKLTDNYIDFLDAYNPASGKPFFSFLFYDLAHAIEIPAPYNKRFQPAAEYFDYLKLDNNTDPTPVLNLYKNCVFHIDQLVAKVLAKLKEKGMLENTIIVITGDHGQEFNENKMNYWGHGSNYSDAQIKVPFVYYEPQRKPATYNYRTCHYDIVPTIMEQALGVTNPAKDYSMGVPLFNATRPPYHIVGDDLNFAFIFDNCIYEKKPTGRVVTTTRNLRPMDGSSINSKELLDAINYKNRFLK